jgi:transcriptional regulator with XRE-family HTH domain
MRHRRVLLQWIFGGWSVKMSSRLGISQEELAFRSGLHRTYVSGVERGIRNPTVVIVKRLAIALEVEPPALLAAKQGRGTGQGR